MPLLSQTSHNNRQDEWSDRSFLSGARSDQDIAGSWSIPGLTNDQEYVSLPASADLDSKVVRSTRENSIASIQRPAQARVGDACSIPCSGYSAHDHSTSCRPVHCIAANPRPHAKDTIKPSPLVLVKLPIVPPFPIGASGEEPSPQDVQEASGSEDNPSTDDRERLLPGQDFGATSDPIQSIDEAVHLATSMHDATSMVGPHPICRGDSDERNASQHHPPPNPFIPRNPSSNPQEDGVFIALSRRTQPFNESLNVAEEETLDVVGFASGRRLPESDDPLSSHRQVAEPEQGTSSEESNSIPNPVQTSERTRTAAARTPPLIDNPLPSEQNPPSDGRTQHPQTTAADVLLHVTENRQRSLEHLMETGGIGGEFRGERRGLLSWLDVNAVLSKMKEIIAAIVLVAVLAVVVAELPRRIHPSQTQ